MVWWIVEDVVDDLKKLRRHHDLRSLIDQVGFQLVQKHGFKRSGADFHYSSKQVRAACQRAKVPSALIKSAEAAFTSRFNFARSYKAAGHGSLEQGGLRYRELRKELAAANGGSTKFIKRSYVSSNWDNGSNFDAARRWGRGI